MNILELAISFIAPHNCIVCSRTGNMLCEACTQSSLKFQPSRCYRCHKATLQHKTCQSCMRQTSLSRVWVAASYDKTSQKLIYKLKFDRAGTASHDIANILAEQLPLLPTDVVVTHLPTVPARIRIRGYDQAQLIAKRLAKNKRLRYQPFLSRIKNTRQVGASRKNRFQQLEGAFSAKNSVKGKHILLVDDVLTTGASLESAAKTLKKAGAARVEAAIFAQA